MKFRLWLTGCLLVLAGCRPPASGNADNGTTTYAARGVVRQIAADLQTITIAHEAIPGYMMAMTMDFSVRDTNELAGLAPADQVTFQLVVSPNASWVTHLQRTGQTGAPAPARGVNVPELKVGDLTPDFAWQDETGAARHLGDFCGQVVAFTFFFTRCPLPDFCPRMNHYFADTRQLLLAATNAPANWQLLSLSFDPDFDTPATLTNYASLYRGENSSHWVFGSVAQIALADLEPRLDLMVMHQGGTISHHLRTVVVDPQGRIAHLFDGNKWTPQDLAAAISALTGTNK